ncbi:MAG: peptidoglycan bridge formation glycyltransferase FemA/FemB family protein, partial [Holdemanella sp.]|nr:peptidoglycan bridge formation glycyltransferase FemA/FemB family protein [Holdemanella sp.]
KKEQIDELKDEHGKEVPLACALFVEYGNRTVYLVGASDYDYRQFKGPYAIQWNMIQRAIDKGYAYYDFYGISGYFEKGKEGYGVFDYKRGYNAKVYEYIGNFVLPINKLKYSVYNRLKSVE